MTRSSCDCKISWQTKKDRSGKKIQLPVRMTDYVAALEDALEGLDPSALKLLQCIFNVEARDKV